MIKKILFAAFALAIFAKGSAQELLSPSMSFSHKKTSYITLNDGKEIKGILDDVDRKKGLVTYVKIEDGEGKKHKLKAADIKYMYLPPSGLDKLTKAMDMLTDAQKWNDDKLNQDLLSQGYIYLENAKVKIKKKERIMVMQLLNPTFSKTVKVYHDPMAKETTSLGVGGMTLAGGNAKSYYIKVGDEVAFKHEKGDYKKEFVPMWKSCNAVITKYKDIKWNELTNHIIDFTNCAQ